MKNMKILNFLFLTIIVLISGSCKKEPVVTPPVITPEPIHLTELGKIEMLRDGSPLVVSAYLYNNNGIYDISTSQRVIAGASLSEGISIEEIPFKKGKFSVQKYSYLNDGFSHVRLFWSVIDELVGVLRSTDDYSEDYIEIIEADTANQTLEGRFQFHLKNVDGTDLSPYGLPDSLHFTKGVFYVKAE